MTHPITTSDKCGKLFNYYTRGQDSPNLKLCEAVFDDGRDDVLIEEDTDSFTLNGLCYDVERGRNGVVFDVKCVSAVPAVPQHGEASAADQKVYQGIADNYMQVIGPKPEMVNHPAHYNKHPSGVEAITVIEHMSFNIGNAMKYMWRADHKAEQIEDLKKAAWYLNREIERLEKAQ